MVLDLVFIVFVLSICFTCKRNGASSETYLSIDNTKKLRGILAIAIVLHHISEKTIAIGKLFPLMVHAGYLVVAVFFFLSGYGCLVSYKKKGRAYLKGFWKNRILYLLLVYVLFIALYALYFKLLGREVTFIGVLYSFGEGRPIAMNSWYIVVQLLMYVFFYVAYIVPNLKNWHRIVLVFIFLLFLAVGLDYIGFKSIWYISNFAFVLGLLYADKKSIIDKLLKNYWWIALVLMMAIFAIFSANPLIIESGDKTDSLEGVFASRHIFRYISSSAFVALVMVCLYKRKIVGVLWEKIGMMSLEIYLIHGMVYSFLRSDFCYIHQDVLWVILTIIITILISIPAHFVSKGISNTLRKT